MEYNDYSNIVVKRVANGTSEVIKLKKDELYSFKFLDNDSLFIREHKVDTINIEGSVLNPGTYKLNRGSTLSEAIRAAGGYDSSAYPFGGYLENLNALEINSMSKQKLYDAFITNLIMNGVSSSNQDSGIGQLLMQIKQRESTGRIIAEFDLDVIKNNPSLDTILEDGDTLLIPQYTQQVYIQGEVANPGAIRYSPGMNIDYYINKSGGILKVGDIKNVFIVQPNGETEHLNSKSRLSFVTAKTDKQLIYPGSIIYIPQNTNFANSIQTASIWAPIISSIALSLTSLSVLNNGN